MSSLSDLRAVTTAFAATAALTDPVAPVRSAIWPTAGRIVDHLGNIQRWAAEVVRTGAPADRREFRRPADADRAPWFREGSDALVSVLEGADPDRIVPILYGATGPTRFWRRRMAHEATKHLWDLRTAAESDPRLPREVSREGAADAVDEFGEVFMAEARRRGIEPLGGTVALVAADTDDSWRVTPAWVLERVAPDATSGEEPGTTITADVGDLVLLLWERADLAAPDRRFRVQGDDALAVTFATTPVHL
ncbi:maleylpyruvate isomerase N-terminal domain-containing protein [Agromyces sp. M3QZ16-3]|uniref:maleylpyruvate isomerase N-terminal domain-containing protein n=1 Tax=Agromyces sp. M3QZ16-3 TaxID=3447585 RepID=UPI003F68FC99